jgi:hypothetical protein
MTDVSTDVVGSVSGERMGEGPGEGGGTDLTEVTGNSEDTTERLATDSGSGIRAAILLVDKVRVVPTGKLVGRGRRIERDSGYFSYWRPVIATTGSGMGIDISSPARGMGTDISAPAHGRGTDKCTSYSARVGTPSSTGSVITRSARSTGCGMTCSIGSGQQPEFLPRRQPFPVCSTF